jgi:CheY-like chemotaxis protein
MVEQTCSFFRQEARLKNIDLNLSIDENLPDLIECDCERLRQVFTNLIGNAIKFTSVGSVSMHVTALPLHHPESQDLIYQVIFTVTDTGIGIPEAALRRVFDPFFQAGLHIQEQFGGSGLGLSIARRLCELMGGQIEATSVEGSGATFRASILGRGAPKGDQANPAATQITSPSRTQRQLSVLLIEDNRVNQRVVRLLLEKLGHHAVVAENGAQALKTLTEGQFDVIFLDLNLPDIDGLDLAKRIRTQLRDCGRDEPVMIALTARALMDDRDRCLQAGMHDYLSKPITLLRLKTVLDKHIL